MSFIGMKLTELGRNLIASAVSEDNPLKFTHVQLGDGTCDGSFSKKEALSQKVMQIPVKSVKRNAGEVVISCDFNSKEAPREFYFREVGIVGNGVLCYYDNSGDDAEYIDPDSEAVVKQKRFRFVLKINEEISVQVNVASGLYALKEELDASVQELEEELDGKVDKTGDASETTVTFTQASGRVNISTGEKLSVLFGKIAKWLADLKTVAFTGKYEDLTGKPTSMPANGGTAETISETLPISKGGTGKTTANDAANVLINGLTEGTDAPVDNDYYVSQYVNGGTAHTSYHRRKMSALWNYIKSKLAAVATSGSYNDLSNKPTIPTVGNGTVTIKQAGVLKGTFTTNQSGNTTIELTDNNTNTWRGIQNNLTSDSTTDGLSAAQGKALKALVDGKAASSHTHSYLPLSGGTVSGDVTTRNIKTGDINYTGSLCASGCSTSGLFGNAIGEGCGATGKWAFASGKDSYSSGQASVAFGGEVSSNGLSSLAAGVGCIARGNYGQAMGYYTDASYFQHVIGSRNKISNGPSSQGAKSGDAFIIGNGTDSSRSNAFRVTGAGAAYACSAFNSSGADYAEFFEWEDGNVDAEDRRGYFVTLCGDKIKLAEPGDYILGVVSAHPTVIGNSDEGWTGRYVTDEFGSYIEEIYEYDEVSVDENGEETTTRKTGITWKQNPDYDPEMTYIQRADRAEWDAVGMMGVLPVRDDGSCEVNGYCTVAEGGIATACSRSASPDVYRVIERSGDNVVKIVVK